MRKSKLFQGHNLAVSESRDVRDFRRALVRFANSLDFKTITAMLVLDQSQAPSEFYVVDNTPPAYLEAYYEPVFMELDPVMQHCKRSSHPIIWDQQTYAKQNAGVLWEQQARHGYHQGIALALHFPGGKHFFLGIDRDQASLRTRRAAEDEVASAKAFAAHAFETAAHLFAPNSEADTPREPLTNLEIEILRWSMDGYSLRDIADIMRFSESAVAALSNSAIYKLRCCTKYQAVIKAIRLALL